MSYGGLKIEGAGMPPLFLKTCTQKLEVIADGSWHRTVNGTLLCTRVLGAKKYRTTCTGEGPAQPGMDRLNLGDHVHIHSVQRLWQQGQFEGVTLERRPAPGSIVVLDEKGGVLAFDQVELMVIPRFLGRPFYVGYCPILEICLTEIRFESQQGELNPQWFIMGEER